MRCSHCNSRIYFMYTDIDYKINCQSCAKKNGYERCRDCYHYYKTYRQCPLCNAESFAKINDEINRLISDMKALSFVPIESDKDKEYVFDEFDYLRREFSRLTNDRFDLDKVVDYLDLAFKGS